MALLGNPLSKHGLQKSYAHLLRQGAAPLALAGALACDIPAHAAPPQRIVSLNLCTDQILVDLVPRARIAAVTHLAADPSVSAAPEKLAGLPVTHGAAEDVLARTPDLIIAGAYTTPATVDLLRRLGRHVVVVPLPETIAGVRALITDMAAAVEEPAAGERLIATLDARIAAVRPPDHLARRPTALVYQINNFVSGSGTLVDEALAIAGLDNQGRAVKTFAHGQTALETVVAAPPDLMVLATRPDAYATTTADNMRHPALAKLLQRVPSIVLDWPLWLCGTHHIATAIERLAAARATIERQPQGRP